VPAVRPTFSRSLCLPPAATHFWRWRPDVVPALLPQEHRLELHQCLIGEEQGWILGGHQRRGPHHRMPPRRRSIRGISPDVAPGHRSGIIRCRLPRCRRGRPPSASRHAPRGAPSRPDSAAPGVVGQPCGRPAAWRASSGSRRRPASSARGELPHLLKNGPRSRLRPSPGESLREELLAQPVAPDPAPAARASAHQRVKAWSST